MGLDMYLTKHTYIGNKYRDPEEQVKVVMPATQKNVIFPIKAEIKSERIFYIVEVVGYWRKANQIHKWFVDNVQEGNDNCREYEVSREQLQELLTVCKTIKEKCSLVEGKVKSGERVVNGKWEPILEDGYQMANAEEAHKLLPTQPGFFFGNTDYDSWYMADIDETIKILEDCLSDSGGEYYYRSSW